QRKTAYARDTAVAAQLNAERALDALSDEQGERRRDQRKFAPGLVANARSLIESGRRIDAANVLKLALEFDPAALDAHALNANLYAAEREYAEAITAAEAWQAGNTSNEMPALLIALCRRALAGKDDPLALDVEFGDLFIRQQLYRFAEDRFPSAAQRFAAHLARIQRTWPGSQDAFSMTSGGKLGDAFWTVRPGDGLRRSDVVDLTALAGMPIETLNLSGSGVLDLTPLAGMPLRLLDVGGTRIKDLAPLARSPLAHLLAVGTRITDLAPIATPLLQQLWIDDTPVVDLAPLRLASALQTLSISGTGVSDLAPLAHLRIDSLHARNCRRLVSLAALRNLKLRRLTLAGTAVGDLTPLADCPLEELDLSDSAVIRLDALARMPLRVLTLVRTDVSDLSPLAGSQLETVELDPRGIAGLAGLPQLRELRSLKAIGPRENGHVLRADEFWRRYDAGEWR
ncbi:MAG: hypothetical protein H0W72_18370, partial [Planctomycetes bacterium]|nr:hypothetical protein [Planctomycetota bacterium]